jgi:dipeptidyl aminopeptidase/acylaminoacyl peptidase
MRSSRRYLTLFGAAVLSMLPAAFGQRLTLQDLVSTEPMGETVLSPDGKTFAISRGGQVALMPATGGWPTPVTSTPGGKSAMSWSPDGKKIAYASGGSIWVVSAAGGAPKRLTNAPPGAGDPRQAGDSAPKWSPKGRWILFTSGRRGTSSLMAVSEDGNATTFLTPAGTDNGQAQWSPDGTRIAFVEIAPQYFSGRLNVLDFDVKSGLPEGEAKVLYTSPVDRGGGWSIRGVEWSPSGKELVTVLQNSGWDHLYVVPVSGGTPKQIADGAFEDSAPRFSPDGRTIAFVSSRGLLEASNVWTMPAGGGEARQVAKFDVPGLETQPEWSEDGKEIFFHRQTPRETSDLYVTAADGTGAPKALTATTPENMAHAVMPERVTWKSKDGHEIVGMLYVPPGEHAKGSLPLMEWVHGGPEGQDTFRGDAWAQYLAGAGFVVLEPNYRGSNGYGEVFRNLNVEDSGGGEVDDVAYGAKYLVERGLVDPKRMSIGGISHGATMTIYMICKYPDMYQAAIEFAGVADRALFNERTNPHSAIRWQMKMGGPAWVVPGNYAKANMLLQVDKIKTPLLVMHGENDPQVPPANAAMLVKAMKEHHKTVFYFTYPNELHWVSTTPHKIDSWEKELAFLDHYINPKIGMTSTSLDEVVFPNPTMAGMGESGGGRR